MSSIPTQPNPSITHPSFHPSISSRPHRILFSPPPLSASCPVSWFLPWFSLTTPPARCSSCLVPAFLVLVGALAVVDCPSFAAACLASINLPSFRLCPIAVNLWTLSSPRVSSHPDFRLQTSHPTCALVWSLQIVTSWNPTLPIAYQLVNRPSATASSHFDTLRPTSGSSNPPLPLLRTLPHSYAYSSLFNPPSTYSPILSVLEAACFVCSIGLLLQPTPVLLHSLPATRTWDRLFLVSPLLRTLTAQSLATYVSLPFAAHGRPSFFAVSVHFHHHPKQKSSTFFANPSSPTVLPATPNPT
ncbi:hypothetical protein K456DRAFT_1139543 [Colletotrichum gloeosporioides 23]|nr:hypothetical protein K456DRAFT_1139543 [Colletotrichum gloeosporioides 23]